MDTEDARKAREKAEADVRRILDGLRTSTDLDITRVEVYIAVIADAGGDPHHEVTGVRIDLSV